MQKSNDRTERLFSSIGTQFLKGKTDYSPRTRNTNRIIVAFIPTPSFPLARHEPKRGLVERAGSALRIAISKILLQTRGDLLELLEATFSNA